VTAYITPTQEQLEQVLGAAAEEPIVMVNLLRFKPEVDGVSGGEVYGRYAAAVAPMLARVGGRILTTMAGRHTVVGPAEEHWDVVALVEYPSPQAFIEMVSTPEYLAAHGDRDAGLADSRLILTTPLTG
jgi:uncharacterized protein (DUF1330 family)